MMIRESYSLHGAPHAVIFAILAMILAADTASFFDQRAKIRRELTRRCGQPLAIKRRSFLRYRFLLDRAHFKQFFCVRICT
jgi:hypothetical protein